MSFTKQLIIFIFFFAIVGYGVQKSEPKRAKPKITIYKLDKKGKRHLIKKPKFAKNSKNLKIGGATAGALVGATETFIWNLDYSGAAYWTAISISGSSDFQLVSNPCIGVSVPCDLTIEYTPTVEGISNSTLNLTLFEPGNGKPPPNDIPDWTANFADSLVGEGYAAPVPECELTEKGSIIREEDRSFSEVVPIVGTNISMYYSSNHAAQFVTSYPKPNRVSSFNPEGWTASLVHRYDQTNNRLFLGTGKFVKRTSLSAGGTNVMVVNDDEVYVFDSTGKHLQTKSLLTGFVKYYFTYSSSRLTKITDAMGLETTFGRNGSGVLQTITSPYSQVTSISVDANGMIDEIENPNSEAYTITYLSGTELMESFAKPGGETSTFEYMGSGELMVDLGAGGNGWGFESGYDGTYRNNLKENAAGLISYMDAKKDSVTGEYERISTSPAGFVTTYTENTDHSSGFSNLFESILNQTTNDERFGSVKKRVSETSETISGLTRTIEYGQTATLSTPSDPYSYTQIVRTKEINNTATTTSTFVKSTKTDTTVDPMGVQTVTIYDNYERPTSVKLGNDTATTRTYDANGRLSQSTQGGQNTIDYTYDANGNLQKIENALGQETTYTYDNAGRKTSVTLPDSRVISYQYNSNGQLTGVTPPSRPQHTFVPNLMELIASYSAPTVSGVSSVTTTYNYNLEKKISEIIRPDTRGIYYSYGATTGLLDLVSFDWGNDVYTYYPNTEKPQYIETADGIQSEFEYFGSNDLKLETQTMGSDTTKITFTRDNFFRITNRALEMNSTSVGSLTTTYRNDNQPSQIGQMTLSYNSTSGRLTSTSLYKIDDTRTYDTYGNLASYTATYTPTSGPVQTLYSYTLTRDTLHRITSKSETIQGVTTSYGYTYDSSGRLSTVTKNAAAHSSYTYDNNSNRTSGTVNGTSFSATYDNQDRMLTYNSNTYYYNDNGDLTSKVDGSSATTSFVSDAFGRLKQVTLPSTDFIEYMLDSNGRRAATWVNSTLVNRAIYESPLKLSADLNPVTSVVKEYVYGSSVNSPEYIKIGSNYYRIIKDHLGSPRLVVKATDGTVLQRMDYNEWGKVVADTNPGAQPFGFAGGLYNTETKLVHFGARDYDPETGRWTSKDPLLFDAGDTNLYGYVLQDPINFIDPEGEEAISVGVGIVGGLLGDLLLGGSAVGTGALINELLDVDPVFNDPGAMCDASGSEPKGGHSNNQRPSNRSKHEKGDSRRRQDQGGDKKRSHPNWQPRNPKKR